EPIRVEGVSGGTCPCCGSESKDIIHTLCRCHSSRLVWALSHIPLRYIILDYNNPETWIHEFRTTLDKVNFGCSSHVFVRLVTSCSLRADEIIERVWSLEVSLLLIHHNPKETEKTRQVHHKIIPPA
ncbi:UNVERIFIED_CONTAM: hypothetical protein Sindi_2029000, partial [Sesamum indicum]